MMILPSRQTFNADVDLHQKLATVLRVKLSLQHMSARIRFAMAILAMLGAMWAAIDLHQHQDGLHQSGQCVVCSLEGSIAHGFTLHVANLAVVPWVAFSAISRLAELSTLACTRLVSIRAPPFA